MLVLSLFHGLDLLGKGFEAEGFCVVRAAEKVLGYDIQEFHPTPNRFDGIIAGSPCQDFSLANRTKRSYNGYGYEMLQEFIRTVTEANPSWFLLENVPQVPHIEVEGYTIQRFNLNASECGLNQNRLRKFQFGSKTGIPLIVPRLPKPSKTEKCCVASEFNNEDRRSFADFCELQGLPRDFDLSHFSQRRKYELVGNGVPIPMGRVIAKAIRDKPVDQSDRSVTKFCICGCGRVIGAESRKTLATGTCRQRVKRTRDNGAELQRRRITF